MSMSFVIYNGGGSVTKNFSKLSGPERSVLSIFTRILKWDERFSRPIDDSKETVNPTFRFKCSESSK